MDSLKKMHDISELLVNVKPPDHIENDNLKGLPHSAREILASLFEKGEMNQRTLSKFVGVSPQAISKTIRTLCKKELVIKKNGVQKNENFISLTSEGKKTAEILCEIIKSKSEDYFLGFSDAEVKIFGEMLNRIEKNILKGEIK